MAELTAFCGTAFAMSWGLWAPMVLGARGLFEPGADLTMPGLYGPTAAAIMLTGLFIGWPGLRDLLGRLLRWRVPVRWYLVALGWPVALALATLAVRSAIGADAPGIEDAAIYQLLPPEEADAPLWQLVLPVFLLTVLGAPLGEEIGWRGYALPRLQRMLNPVMASLCLGVVWALWHVPLFLVPELPQADYSPVWFGLSVLSAALLFTWIYNGARSSLLLVILFHAASNTGSVMFPINTHTDPVAVSLQVLVATLIGFRMLRRGRQASGVMGVGHVGHR